MKQSAGAEGQAMLLGKVFVDEMEPSHVIEQHAPEPRLFQWHP